MPPQGLCEWETVVSSHMPHLSKPQVKVLALYSFGMAMTRSCGLTGIVCFLGELLEKKEWALRQQLREWNYAAADKAGKKRRAVAVESCFASLLRWVLSWWGSEEKRLVLALDASTLKDVFTILAVSVVYRGCAIPVAWVILPANEKGKWKWQWLALLRQLQGCVPEGWTVLVLSDRGLYARWLYRKIKRLHWHPFMRINMQGYYRAKGERHYLPLASLLAKGSEEWQGEVFCFKGEARLRCTLLARWDEKHKEPWLIVTDLPPRSANAAWYGMRAWIESFFKDCKRGGWQWHCSKMSDPKRAERLWLVIAVTTLWVVSVGGEADASLPASSLELAPLPPVQCTARPPDKRHRPRLLSCFRRGLNIILARLLRGEGIALGRFIPEPWPSPMPQVVPC